MRNHIWKTWARALGEKASKHKHEADAVAIIRTIIFLSYLATNAFIISGVIRHWNNNQKPPTVILVECGESVGQFPLSGGLRGAAIR